MATQQPVQEGYYKRDDGGWEIIANHEIQGVTPEMLDWWWDHIDTTERYKLWHPTDHQSFEWLVSPANGHIGAVQRIEESFGNIPSTPIEIRWEDPKGALTEYDHVLLASSKIHGERAADLMHEYEVASFGTRLRTHFHFPPGAPKEFVKAVYQHNKEEMRYFSTFLPTCIAPKLEQKKTYNLVLITYSTHSNGDRIHFREEGFLMATQQPVQEGYYKRDDGGWEIIANHEIQGVTPEMLDWWWDHIDTTERYKLWHPTDHQSFEWLVSPANGHIGAVQRIEESFGNIPSTPIEIRWEDPKGALTEYDHVLLASSKIYGERAADLMHEYEVASFGTRLRTHFHFPPGAPKEFVKAVYQHNKEEMRYFSTFLPDLYRSQIGAERE